MEEHEANKEFNHSKTSVSDKIRLISELEHIRYHAVRSAAVLVTEEKNEEAFKFLIVAKQTQDIRRKYMTKHFPQIDSKSWCLCKSAACLRQTAYEVCEADGEELQEIDALVDYIWGSALGIDLSDCEACQSDMEADIVEE